MLRRGAVFRRSPESKALAKHEARLRFQSRDCAKKRSGYGDEEPFEQKPPFPMVRLFFWAGRQERKRNNRGECEPDHRGRHQNLGDFREVMRKDRKKKPYHWKWWLLLEW